MSAVRYQLEFTEEMKGWFAFGTDGFAAGAEQGRRAGCSLMFHLTISTEDVHRFIRDRDHLARASGWVKSDVLGGRLAVGRGDFNLFVDDGPHRKRMLYRLFFEDGAGHPLTLSGFKDIRPNRVSHVWPETTTLYTRVLQGHVDAGGEAGAVLVGSGILRILPQDFARQLTTFRVRGGTRPGRLEALGGFADLFVGQLWHVFGARVRGARAGRLAVRSRS